MMRKAVAGALALLALGAIGAAYVIEQVGVTPRALAPYIEKRTSGHNPVIVKAGQVSAALLLRLDRGEPALPAALAVTLGAQPGAVGVDAAGAIMVAHVREGLTRHQDHGAPEDGGGDERSG